MTNLKEESMDPSFWKFQLGDVVQYLHEPGDQAVIVDRKTSEEIDPDMDSGQPWYVVLWLAKNRLGQEHEGQFVLVFRPNPESLLPEPQ